MIEFKTFQKLKFSSIKDTKINLFWVALSVKCVVFDYFRSIVDVWNSDICKQEISCQLDYINKIRYNNDAFNYFSITYAATIKTEDSAIIAVTVMIDPHFSCGCIQKFSCNLYFEYLDSFRFSRYIPKLSFVRFKISEEEHQLFINVYKIFL